MCNPENRRANVNPTRESMRLTWITVCVLVLPGYSLLSGEQVDASKLPPPATVQVDFARDIKPILETSCLRCHGPEKPKSRFRLDNRDDALKGGNQGVDILPGNGAKSPLIHYVARLVEDMAMPPEGKGEPLTSDQVALLRAWIDQGVAWDAGATTSSFDFFMSPAFGWTFVEGDRHKFREHNWRREGANGGLERFEMFDQSVPDTKVSVSGHVLRDDYKVVLSAEKRDLGFIHTGWEQYRKYFDDTGGYIPLAGVSTAPSLGEDLHLDRGKAWVDFGLTLPDWPRMVLGYEYDYKRGKEAITSWGSSGPAVDLRNFGPAAKDIRETVHIIKFDLDHEIKGVAIEERFRGEFYHLNTYRTNISARAAITESVTEGNHYFQGANTIRLEKKLKDWLLTSAGYLYSKLNADATFTDTVTFGGTTYLSEVPQITLEKESHVLNLNGLIGPFNGLTISAGAQSDWTSQHGFGNGRLNSIYYSGPPIAANLAVNPAEFVSDYDQSSVSESAALRYTKIPLTVLFAEARLQQQSIGHSVYEFQPTPNGNFLDNIAFTSQLTDLRAGFNTSPWKRAALSAHYRRYENESHYGNNQNALPAAGYPGFIRERNLLTDEVQAKLVLRPASWMKATLSYKILTTDYRTDTETAAGNGSAGGGLLAGKYDAEVYSIGLTLTPKRRLSVTTSFSYQPTKLNTASSGFAAVVPYRGDVFSVVASGTYVLSQSTDLFANYTFSRADYGQDNFASTVPVGIEYQLHGGQVGFSRRLSKNMSCKLLYSFNYYDEPSTGRANNYRAHGVFGMLTLRLP